MNQNSRNIRKHALFKNSLCRISRTFLGFFSISIVWLCFINICTEYPWRNLGVIPQVLPEQKLWKENIYQKSLNRNSLPKNICREICTKNLRRAILYQINLEKTSSRINSEDKVFTKHVWREITTKKYVKKSTKYLYRDIPRQKIGKRNLCQKLLQTFLPKSLWRNLYQKLFEKKSMPNKFQQKPLPKKKWKNRFYHKIS